MSYSSSTGIHFSGLSSGIDVDSIISALTQAQSYKIQRLQAQQATLQYQQTIYSQFRSKLNALGSAMDTLNLKASYSPTKVSSSDDTIATATADSSAVAGTYNLDVQELAAAHKVTSAAKSNSTDALGLSGTFVVNGKSVAVGASDTLADVAAKVNGANAGVTASILNGGTNATYLVFSSVNSGASNKLELSDLSGTVLNQLGVISGTASVRDASGGANTALSHAFSSSSDTLQSMIGTAATGSFQIGAGGATVNYDFSTDSLQDIANKINTSGEAGVSATVLSNTVNGKTVYQLQISGADVPSTIVDTNGGLEGLGILQRGYDHEISAAKDAKVVVDGLTVTSSSNTVTGVVQGVSINLVAKGTTNLSLTRDTDSVKSTIETLQSSYNDVVDYISTNSSFDAKTYQSGPLFGDQTASQVQASMVNILFSNIGTGTYKNLTDIGFGVDSGGKLTVDEAKLTAALNNDPEGVKNLLMATGSSANTAIKYVSSGSNTLASSAGGYVVDITQAATQSSNVGLVAKTTANVSGETLTFDGALFGSTPINLSLDAGSSLTDIIDKINNDARLKNSVVASDDGSGHLKIVSKTWGSKSAFTVVSNLDAAADNSGIGKTGGTTVDGVDVAGTINGEAATGTGQFLKGNTGNANTEDLQIQYAGTTTGTVGSIVFNRGVASLLKYRVNGYTDSVNGVLKTKDDSLQAQIDDLNDSINSANDSLSAQTDILRQKYAAMESTIQALQSQGNSLSSMLSGLSRG